VTDEGWIKAERAHERDMAEIKSKNDYRQREAITTRIGYISTAFGIVGVTAILAWLIISWVDSNGERGHQLEQTCIAAGGTWTTINSGNSKVCIHIDGVE